MQDHNTIELTTISNSKISVDPDTILFIRIENGYCRLYRTDNTKHIITNIISEIATQLKDFSFFKIHRTCIVNLEYVENYGVYPGKELLVNNYRVVLAKRKRLVFHNAFIRYNKNIT